MAIVEMRNEIDIREFGRNYFMLHVTDNKLYQAIKNDSRIIKEYEYQDGYSGDCVAIDLLIAEKSRDGILKLIEQFIKTGRILIKKGIRKNGRQKQLQFSSRVVVGDRITGTIGYRPKYPRRTQSKQAISVYSTQYEKARLFS